MFKNQEILYNYLGVWFFLMIKRCGSIGFVQSQGSSWLDLSGYIVVQVYDFYYYIFGFIQVFDFEFLVRELVFVFVGEVF